MAPYSPDIREDGLRELREIRLRRGLSQADLSAITGVTEFTISEIESGKRANPRPSTLRKLAQALEVDVSALYGGPTYPKVQAPLPLEGLAGGAGDPVQAAKIIRALASTAAELARAWNRDVEFYEQHGRSLLPYRTMEMGLAVEALYEHLWGALAVLQRHAESLGLDPDPATWEPQSKEFLVEAGSNIRALAELYALIERSAAATDADRENLQARREEFGGSTLAGLEELERDPRWPDAIEKARTKAGIT
jgi:transcriptional regulator with XRE-family HTH domain